MQGTFRRGFPAQQQGSATDAGNGFMLFVSATGAEFTIRAEEFTARDDSKTEAERKRAIVASWPRGCLQFKLSRPRNGGAASLMVKRTPGGALHAIPSDAAVETTDAVIGELKREAA